MQHFIGIIFSLNKMQLFEVRAIIEEMQEELNSQHVCWELAGEIYLFQLLIMLPNAKIGRADIRILRDLPVLAGAGKNLFLFLFWCGII